MDCSKKSEGAVAALPDDPLVEILSRVPAKSVCRFKCVSKAWRDLIADPHHRKKLRQAMQGLFFMKLELDYLSFSFSFIDLIARSVPLDIDPGFSFLRERPGFQNLFLLDSCNGLILFSHHKYNTSCSDASGYIVCNPTTKQWAVVPACGSPSLTTYTYLAFDQAISSHFHLLQFQVKYHEKEMLVSLHAYSSETGTWSHNQIDSQEEQGPLARWHRHVKLSYRYPQPHCAFVNGFLHLTVWNLDLLQIVVLDVQGKIKWMITVPGEAADVDHRYLYLGQSQGCLNYVNHKVLDAHEQSSKVSIWVLQDYDTQEWVLKDTMTSTEILGKLSGNLSNWEVAGIHQDCNVLLLFEWGRVRGKKLIACDMDHKEVSVIATLEERTFSFARCVPCFSESPALTNQH